MVIIIQTASLGWRARSHTLHRIHLFIGTAAECSSHSVTALQRMTSIAFMCIGTCVVHLICECLCVYFFLYLSHLLNTKER